MKSLKFLDHTIGKSTKLRVQRWRLDELEDDTSSWYCSSSRRVSTRWRLDELEDDTSSWYCSSSRRVSTGSVRGLEKSVQGSEKKSILEADVAQDDWWIKKITAANDEI
nr:hypothetical protein [Tanacetum cinerariifolium]